MGKGTTLVLAAVAAALLGYILIFERGSLTSGETAERAGRVLPHLVRPKLSRLELQRKGVTVVLARERGDDGELEPWRVLEPYQDEADQDGVDLVLGELEWLEARRRFEQVTAEDRALFGLDKPRFRVWFTAGGERHALILGKEDVHKDSVYATGDDPRVAFAVPKTVVEALDHPPGHFRTKQFIGEITVAWAREIELRSAAGHTHMERAGERWFVDGEVRTFGDKRRIEELLRAFDDLRATRYVEQDPEGRYAASLREPFLSVVVKLIPDAAREDQEARGLQLRVGAACRDHEGERVARLGDDGPLVCVREEDLEPFTEPNGAYRQGKLWSVGSSSEVEAFRVSAAGRSLALKRDGERWLPDKGTDGDLQVDRETVELWLADVDKARVRRFVDDVAGFEPRVTLWIRRADGGEEEIQLGGLAPDGTVYVRRGEQEPVLAAYAQQLAELLGPEPERFQPLALWELKPSQVVGLTARFEGAEVRLVRETDWRPAPGAPPVPRQQALRDQVRALTKLRALRFVAAEPRAAHGLARPRGQLSVRLADAAQASGGALSLAIGAETEDGAYVRVGEGPVFELDRSSVALVKRVAQGVRGGPADAAPGRDDEVAEADEHEHNHGDEHDHP